MLPVHAFIFNSKVTLKLMLLLKTSATREGGVSTPRSALPAFVLMTSLPDELSVFTSRLCAEQRCALPPEYRARRL